jgi:ketosteroid isomerase-like protein
MNNEKTMRTVMSAFGKSDLGPLMEVLHPDVVWKSASREPGLFSFQGEYKNRAGVIEVLSNISKNYTFHHITPKEITAAGDVVWALCDLKVSYDAKGQGIAPKIIEMQMAVRWTFKEGKVIEHQAFMDTAHLAIAQGAMKS